MAFQIALPYQHIPCHEQRLNLSDYSPKAFRTDQYDDYMSLSRSKYTKGSLELCKPKLRNIRPLVRNQPKIF